MFNSQSLICNYQSDNCAFPHFLAMLLRFSNKMTACMNHKTSSMLSCQAQTQILYNLKRFTILLHKLHHCTTTLRPLVVCNESLWHLNANHKSPCLRFLRFFLGSPFFTSGELDSFLQPNSISRCLRSFMPINGVFRPSGKNIFC